MCVAAGPVFMIASALSAGVSALASIQQGNAEYAAGMMNSEIAMRNVQAAEDEQKNVKDAAAIERRRLGEQIRAERGAKRAQFAHMGLDADFGTPFDIDQDILRAGQADAALIGRNEMTEIGRLDKERADYMDSANMARAGAKSARTAGFIGAAGSLLQGAATVSSRWIQPTQTGAGRPPLTKPRPTTHSGTKTGLTIGAG